MIDFARESAYPTPFSNSSFLPLLLMSLASQKNSPSPIQTPITIFNEYDFIIIGAGSAGSTVASRLSEIPFVSVLLLEAGKPPPVLNDIPAIARSFWLTDLDWQYKTTPQKHTGRLLVNRQVIWPSGKGLGGSSLLNAMLAIRGNRKNYDDWEAQGAEGWSYDDVLPYFKKLEDNQNLEYILNDYHGVGGPITVQKPKYDAEIKDPIFEAAKDIGYDVVDSNGPRQTGFFDYQATVRDGQRCSTAKGYLVPAEDRENLHILTNAFVTKILLQNGVAVGVTFEVNGQRYGVKAMREVILSAGTTNTAQLLMLSGIGPKDELQKHKIPVLADLPVGHNLQDHCSAILNYELSPSISPALVKITDPKNVKDYIEDRNGPLAAPELVSALAFLNGRYVRPKTDRPNFELYFGELPAELAKTQLGLTKTAYRQIYGPYEGKPIYVCVSQILQPKSRGRVTLHSSNPYDPPVINPNYLSDERDLKDIVQGMKVCQQIGTSKAMQKVGSRPFRTSYPGCEKFFKNKNKDEYFKCVARSLVVTMSHQVGTAKMGDPKHSSTVVDPELKVKGIRGLRVVDASVMPIVPSGNTNIPVIMVAEKASDIIKKSIFS